MLYYYSFFGTTKKGENLFGDGAFSTKDGKLTMKDIEWLKADLVESGRVDFGPTILSIFPVEENREETDEE